MTTADLKAGPQVIPDCLAPTGTRPASWGAPSTRVQESSTPLSVLEPSATRVSNQRAIAEPRRPSLLSLSWSGPPWARSWSTESATIARSVGAAATTSNSTRGDPSEE